MKIKTLMHRKKGWQNLLEHAKEIISLMPQGDIRGSHLRLPP
jgi:hypothetical protein